ncbi:MAG: hypothetical protein M3288_00425 [Thermoproteota archaeon]|nr:hypothetical protein [Thermoproteota archaeon]
MFIRINCIDRWNLLIRSEFPNTNESLTIHPSAASAGVRTSEFVIP